MLTTPSFNYDGYQFKNVYCSEKNFKKQEGFKSSGTRSLLVPEEDQDYKFINGFPIRKDARIYLPDKSSIPINQESVFFTYKSILYRASELELKLPKNVVLTEISLEDYRKESTGFIKISHVIKPTPINLNRVNTGDSAQKIVGEHFKSLYPEITYEINKPGSNKPDLIIFYKDKEYSVEVKNSANGLKSIHCIFDKSVSRNKLINNYIEQISKTYCNILKIELNCNSYFLTLIDYYRKLDMSIGFPEDEGTKKSGKLPKELLTENIEIIKTLKEIIINHFQEKKDDFFAIYNRKSGAVEGFSVGKDKENVFGFPELADIFYGGISTYGGISSGSMRVGFKCKFS